jgi:hypothetical protein
LQPLLLTAATVSDIPAPQASSLAMERRQQRMFAAFEAKSRQGVSNSLFSRYTGQLHRSIINFIALLTGKENNPMTPIARFATVAILVIILVSTTGGATLAFANALPGDALYPIKTSMEQVQLVLATDPHER